MTDFERVYGGIGIHVDFPKTIGNILVLSTADPKINYFYNQWYEHDND